MLLNGSLHVSHVGSYDTGTYLCYGINQVSSVNASITVTVPASRDSCDFETDPCIWRDSVKDTDFFWVWQQGCTPSYGTGPCKDHTTGSELGHYMYVEASWPRTEGDVAELQSEWLSTTNVRTAPLLLV